MTSFAPIPTPDEVPRGMKHVGWYCNSPDHDCLMPFSQADDWNWSNGEAHLYDANHHASWRPVYVLLSDEDGDAERYEDAT